MSVVLRCLNIYSEISPINRFAIKPVFSSCRGVRRGDERTRERHVQQHADAQSGEQDHHHRRLQYVRPPHAHIESAVTQLTCVSILMTLQLVILCCKISSNLVLCVAALTMQILKPAGFIETAHYPLLLLV